MRRLSIRFIMCQRTSKVKSTTTKHKIRGVEKFAIIEMSSNPPTARVNEFETSSHGI